MICQGRYHLFMILVFARHSISMRRCNLNYTTFDNPHNVACKGRAALQDGVCKSMNYNNGFMQSQIGWIENYTLFQQSDVLHRCWHNITSRNMTNLTICLIRPSLVLTKINWEQLRNVNDKKRTVTLDISTTKFWTDRRLKTYKLKIDDGLYGKNSNRKDKREVGLSPEDAEKIWTPDVHVYNISDYRSFMSSIEIVSMKVLKTDASFKGLCLPGPLIQYKVQAKVTFYCNLDYTYYPKDMSTCRLRFGSTRSDLGYVLYDKKKLRRKYKSTNFEIEIETIQERRGNSSLPSVGLDIKLTRLIKPFILKYYLPCGMITCLSQCSFIIPLTALPGRVALTVTQLLTLTSIFIQQMVRTLLNCHK